MTLDQVLADFGEEATILRANGNIGQAVSVERVCNAVRAASTLYLDWLSEREATMRSGKSGEWLRVRFDAWEQDGLAERRGKKRYYRGVVVPRGVLVSLVREAAARERAG